MSTEAPTPEEIAEELSDKWCGEPSPGSIAAALRAFGDRRYCEARDAAGAAALDEYDATYIGSNPKACISRIAEAIRKLTP